MATELEVPYATLRKQLQREPLRSWITPFLTMKGNTKYITEEGERVIRWQYPEKEPKIKELEEMIRRELEEKNARIRQLEEELEAEHKKNELLRSIQERLQKIEQSVNGTPLKSPATEEKESGLFAWQKKK